MSKRKKTNLRIVKEIYGDRKIEEVFEELYEKIYGLKVKVRRKTSVELVAEKQQEKNILRSNYNVKTTTIQNIESHYRKLL